MKSVRFVFVILFFFSINVLAAVPQRVLIDSSSVKIDSFVYQPENLAHAKGVILVIGGSGFTHAGFGGPSKLCQFASSKGYVCVEWNKRGLKTNIELNAIEKNLEIYNTATIENIYYDAKSVLLYMNSRFPDLKLFVAGGSEGSVTTTLLAERNPNLIKAVSTFGNVVVPFVQVLHNQLTDLTVKKWWSILDADNNSYLDEVEYSKALQSGKLGQDLIQLLSSFKFDEIDITQDHRVNFDELSRMIATYFLKTMPNLDQYWLDSSGVAKGWIESMLKLPSLYERSQKILVPVFVVQGEDDWNTPVQDVYKFELFSKKLGLSNFTFKYYAGVGHAPSPEMFSDILSFFDGI